MADNFLKEVAWTYCSDKPDEAREDLKQKRQLPDFDFQFEQARLRLMGLLDDSLANEMSPEKFAALKAAQAATLARRKA